MNSRGAATECSPGREPGVFFRHDLSPGRKSLSESFAPSGLRSRTTPTPGLRPGLHSVAAPRLNTAQVLARAHSGSFLDRNHNLDRSAVARRECALPHHTGIRIPMQKIFSIIIATLLFVVPVCAADINVVTSGAFTAAYTSWPAVLGCQVRHAGRRLAMMGRLLVRVSELDQGWLAVRTPKKRNTDRKVV